MELVVESGDGSPSHPNLLFQAFARFARKNGSGESASRS